MTISEAKSILHCPDAYGGIHGEKYGQALAVAFRCMEVCEADTLDKIRAEIMDFEEELFHRPNTDYADYAAVRHCVEIIDKYKAGEEE